MPAKRGEGNSAERIHSAPAVGHAAVAEPARRGALAVRGATPVAE